MRLRQVVLVAADLDPVVEELRAALGAGEPYHDPGVALFGLRNAVLPLGEEFVEVVCPDAPDTAAGRHRERLGGDGGYMVMFETGDLAGARNRAREHGVREVWAIDLDEIAATHLHPSDLGGAIVSVDRPATPGEWLWAGAGWRDRAGRGGVTGATIAVPDPEAAAARWAAVLGEPAPGITFAEGDRGLVEVEVEGALQEPAVIAGVRFTPSRR